MATQTYDVSQMLMPTGTGMGINFGTRYEDGEFSLTIPSHAGVDRLQIAIFDGDSDRVTRMEDFISCPIMVEDEQLTMWQCIILCDTDRPVFYNLIADGQVILDPYAKEPARPITYHGGQCIIPRCVARKYPELTANRVARPTTPVKNGVVYEVNVGQFTEHGYRGLMEKAAYFQEMGITHLELMPVAEYQNGGRGFWGYNSALFFSPHGGYASAYGQGLHVKELVAMIDHFHSFGISVIVDVVVNHTAEGNEFGPVLHMKALLDNGTPQGFYEKHNNGTYANGSGCGNTTNARSSVFRRMVADALAFWYQEIGVDGFRFDLAGLLGSQLLKEIANDPRLRSAELIAEPWAPDGRQVAHVVGKHARKMVLECGEGWLPWNDKSYQVFRKVLLSRYRQVRKLLDLLLVGDQINFFACHDGAPLADLDKAKINEGGPLFDPRWSGCPSDIMRRLQTQAFALLLTARSVPLLNMGDEVGRSQGGHSNGYDEPGSFPWDNVATFDWLRTFVTKVISLRKWLGIGGSSLVYDANDLQSPGQCLVSMHGVRRDIPHQESGWARFLACEYRWFGSNRNFYFATNWHDGDITVQLPAPPAGTRWFVIMNSANAEAWSPEEAPMMQTDEFLVGSRSTVWLVALPA